MCSPPLIRNHWSVVLHDRCIPHHNSIRQVRASVWLMPDSTRWHEPLVEHLSRSELASSPWLWIYNFQPSNRLSKVNSGPFFHFSPCPIVCRWLNNWPQYWASPSFAFHPVVCRWLNIWPQYQASFPFVSRGNLLFQLWSRDWPASGIATWQGSGFRTCFPGVVTFLWLIWWGQVVHEFEGWLLQPSTELIWIFGHWAWSGDSALDCGRINLLLKHAGIDIHTFSNRPQPHHTLCFPRH
jgi:hypothetical protein